MFLDSDFHLSDKWRGASCHLLRIRPPLGPNARLNSSTASSVGQRLNSESFNWTLFLAFWIWSPRSQWTSLRWLTRNLFWAAVPTPPCSTSWRASMAKTKTTEASKCLLLFKSGWTTWSDPKQSLSERIISGRSALNYRAAYDYHHESVVFQSPKSELTYSILSMRLAFNVISYETMVRLCHFPRTLYKLITEVHQFCWSH